MMYKYFFLKSCIFYMLLLGASPGLYAQTVVTGRVTDGTNPLPGVSVTIKGTTEGTQTDFNGEYAISAPRGAVLQFAFLGFRSREIVVENQSIINVALEGDAEQLAEVEVIGPLGIKREFKSIGYAVSNISGEELTKAGATLNPVLSLYGKASGVGVNVGSAGPMGGINIKIRGAAALDASSNTRPLFVVDGVIIQDEPTNMAGRDYDNLNSFDYGTAINDINPQDIESVVILKGAKAAVLYGQDGANGVVLITTKSGRNVKGFGIQASTQF
ncbi:MAG TPA: carboxypeptidase-like regulatory domain-containing protein, partial [Anseongella sp.]|nr:carboxypeptidase-like regulatory domain-containing protein [Anseongella sp.]